MNSNLNEASPSEQPKSQPTIDGKPSELSVDSPSANSPSLKEVFGRDFNSLDDAGKAYREEAKTLYAQGQKIAELERRLRSAETPTPVVSNEGEFSWLTPEIEKVVNRVVEQKISPLKTQSYVVEKRLNDKDFAENEAEIIDVLKNATDPFELGKQAVMSKKYAAKATALEKEVKELKAKTELRPYSESGASVPTPPVSDESEYAKADAANDAKTMVRLQLKKHGMTSK